MVNISLQVLLLSNFQNILYWSFFQKCLIGFAVFERFAYEISLQLCTIFAQLFFSILLITFYILLMCQSNFYLAWAFDDNFLRFWIQFSIWAKEKIVLLLNSSSFKKFMSQSYLTQRKKIRTRINIILCNFNSLFKATSILVQKLFVL